MRGIARRTRIWVLLGVLLVLAGVYPPIHQRRMNDALATAVLSGDAAGVRGALRWGADPNARTQSMRTTADTGIWAYWRRLLTGRRSTAPMAGTPVLTVASRMNRPDIVDALLARGADPNAAGTGRTALVGAVSLSNPRIALALLKAGARADAVGADGAPLIVTAARRSAPTVGALLDRGARVEAADADGWTPLMVAAEAGNAEAVALLLARGADPRAPARAGMEPFLWAARAGSVEMLAALWRARSPRDPDPKALATAGLCLAADGGHEAAARQLLVWGAAADGLPAGMGPQWQHQPATNAGPPGAQPARRSSQERVELPWAVRADTPPLVAAARSGSRPVLELLLARGANVNRQAADGQTALAAAVAARHLEVARVLLARGADANRGDALREAVLARDEPLVRELVRRGADVRRAARGGRTPLHEAGYSAQVVRLLLDHGADPDARDASRQTVLMSPATSEAAALLLDRGADPNAVDASGKTVLHHCVRSFEPRVVEALLKHHASVNAVDPSGRTALTLVVNMGGDQNPTSSPLRRIHDLLVAAGGKAPPSRPATPTERPPGAIIIRGRAYMTATPRAGRAATPGALRTNR